MYGQLFTKEEKGGSERLRELDITSWVWNDVPLACNNFARLHWIAPVRTKLELQRKINRKALSARRRRSRTAYDRKAKQKRNAAASVSETACSKCPPLNALGVERSTINWRRGGYGARLIKFSSVRSSLSLTLAACFTILWEQFSFDQRAQLCPFLLVLLQIPHSLFCPWLPIAEVACVFSVGTTPSTRFGATLSSQTRIHVAQREYKIKKRHKSWPFSCL